MASPSEKYSSMARIVTTPKATATQAVEANNTKTTTNGIRTTAVATRFQVITRGSPDAREASSHPIEKGKSRNREAKEKERCRVLILRPRVPAFPSLDRLRGFLHN